MIKRRLLFLAAFHLVCTTSSADPSDAQHALHGYGEPGYVWNALTAEQKDVLALQGDAIRGREAYRHCQGCHRPDGSGRTDGTYPRLSGQHAAVIIKQITDTRSGVRTNPKMEPFAKEHEVSHQEIADIAVHLSHLRTLAENGKGDALDESNGAALYRQRGCADCHGPAGEGDHTKYYPVVAGQHYGYLLHELEHIQVGGRGNSHPEMVRSLKGLRADDLRSLASYMSRLPDPRDLRR